MRSGCICAVPGGRERRSPCRNRWKAHANDSGQLTLADTLPDEAVMEDDCERRDSAGRLKMLIRQLPEREGHILALRYGLGGAPELTQQAVAARLGISRSYVSRIEKRALDHLRRLWENF